MLYRKLMRTDVYLPIMGTGLATTSPGNFGFPNVFRMNLSLLGLPGEFVGWGNQSFPGPTSNGPLRTKPPSAFSCSKGCFRQLLWFSNQSMGVLVMCFVKGISNGRISSVLSCCIAACCSPSVRTVRTRSTATPRS